MLYILSIWLSSVIFFNLKSKKTFFCLNRNYSFERKQTESPEACPWRSRWTFLHLDRECFPQTGWAVRHLAQTFHPEGRLQVSNRGVTLLLQRRNKLFLWWASTSWSVFLKVCDSYWSSESNKLSAHPSCQVVSQINNSFQWFVPACPCTRWPTQIWAGSWRARRSRKHCVHLRKFCSLWMFNTLRDQQWWFSTSGPCFWILIILEVLSNSFSSWVWF